MILSRLRRQCPSLARAYWSTSWEGAHRTNCLHGSQRQCDMDLSPLLAAFAAVLAPAVKADDAPKDVKGLFLMSDYPAVTLRPGETSIGQSAITELRHGAGASGAVGFRRADGLDGNADGRRPAGCRGDAGDQFQRLASLRLDVPKNAAMGTQTLTVAAAGDSTNLELPIAVTLAKDLPAKLTLTPQLPELRGTSKSSFEYQLSIKNDSGKKLTVSLSAQAPQNFDASFTEQYGSQELNAVPVDAGQTQGREAQSYAAEYGRGRRLQGHGAGRRRRRFGDHRSRPRHHRPAQA